jgi:hypothetical protein
MSRKIWNLLIFAAAELVCFGLWMVMLGNCYIDGFLDLDVVEAGDIGVKYDFVILCLFPSIMTGYCVNDLIADAIKKRRAKNGNKEQN